ncbi:SCO family protein [Chiayiivirga flava]|uniref:Protein SCO1/2 n=1 Tax=Chiayiivirga flava TaxID=659595 RepID=A0A7W8FZ12_9GAMM|nr:SCO family protein [Chiayiivirga flava]MBB5206679.1 protein SCO1/2 [Chiayiivirga flava]
MTDTPAASPSPPRRTGRLPILAVIVVAVAAGLGLWAGQRWFGGLAAQPALATTVLYGAPRPLPPFTLQGSDGQPLTAAQLQGRWTLVFLGFLHCPDICPTTLATLGQAQKQLADIPADRQPRVLFVSVDYERDEPAQIGAYARHFSPDALAGTGSKAQLDAFANGLGMLYMKTPLADGDYTIDHSATIAVLDPQARIAGLIRPPLDAAKIAADLRTLVSR